MNWLQKIADIDPTKFQEQLDATERDNDKAEQFVAQNRQQDEFSAFTDIADMQRGDPEAAMLRIQDSQICQLYGWLAEHVGDLTHRMTEKMKFLRGGYEFVKEKVNKTLNTLNRDLDWMMPFEQDVEQQIIRNVQFCNNPENKQYYPYVPASTDEAWEKLSALGKAYANEHRKLPVFNRVQILARDAAIAVGEMRFDDARSKLSALKSIIDKGSKAWEKEAMARS